MTMAITAHFNMHMDPGLHGEMQLVAHQLGVSAAEFVRGAICDAIAQHRLGPGTVPGSASGAASADLQPPAAAAAGGGAQ